MCSGPAEKRGIGFAVYNNPPKKRRGAFLGSAVFSVLPILSILASPLKVFAQKRRAEPRDIGNQQQYDKLDGKVRHNAFYDLRDGLFEGITCNKQVHSDRRRQKTQGQITPVCTG